MQNIQVEINGKLKTVSIEDLRDFFGKKFIDGDTRIIVDGVEGRVQQIALQLAAKAPVIKISSGGGPKPSAPKKPGASPAPNGAASPLISPVPQPNVEGMISLDDLEDAPQNASFAPPPTQRKKLPVWIFALIPVVLIAIGSVAFFAVKVVRKDSAPTGPEAQSVTEMTETEEGKKNDETSYTSEESADLQQMEFNGSFNVAAKRIDTNYKGVDIDRLYDALQSVCNFEKDQYETTQQFLERKNQFFVQPENQILFDDVKFGSRFAYPLSVKTVKKDNPESIEAQYDADRQILSLSLGYGANTLDIKNLYNRHLTIYQDLDSSFYTAENAFGAEKRVEERVAISCELVYNVKENRRNDQEKDQNVVRLSGIAPEEARKLDNTLRALAVFSVDLRSIDDSPKATDAHYFKSDKPTMSNPFSLETLDRYIFAKNVEVWIYNKNTGDIIAKFSQQELSDNVTKPLERATVIQESDVPIQTSESSTSEDDSTGVSETKSTTVGEKSSPQEAEESEILEEAPLEYSVDPINPNAVTLPENFAGHDFNAVADALAKLDSTDEDAPLFGNLKRSSYFAQLICNKESKGARLPIKFDSSRTGITVKCDSVYFRPFMDRPIPSGRIDSNYLVALDLSIPRAEDESPYSSDKKGLVLCNLMTNVIDYDYLVFELKNAPAVKADALKKSARALLVYTIATGDSIQNISESPLFIKSDSTRILVDSVEFWFFNAETGEIFSKYTLREALSLKVKNYGDVARSNAFVGMNMFSFVDGKPAFTKDPNGPKVKRNVRNDKETENTKEIARDNESEETDKQVGESEKEAPPLPSWDQLFAERSDEEEAWEKKKPTITVPGDAATLDEAVQKARPGDVILLKSGQPRPFALGGKRKSSSDVDGVRVDKSIAIIGETGNAQDIIVSVETNESVVIDSKGVHFKGIFFKSANGRRDRQAQPMVSVESGSAQFKYCDFSGEKNVDTFGIRAKGPKSTAKCWKCNFTSYDKRAVFATEGGKATCEYCRFEKSDESVSTFDDGVAELTRCLFSNNGVAFVADGGGGGFLKENYFESNKGDWSISMGSSDKVKLFGNVSEGKATRDNFTPEEE